MEDPVIPSSNLASPGSARATTATRFARIGLWLIPIYGALLALSTFTHQPDYDTDFQSYAEYITTDRFLVSHLGASIAGAALGSLGIVAALAFLARGPTVAAAIIGTALTIASNVLLTAVFGAAAFAQPAIGRAYLGGASGIRELNDDVYDTPLFATAGLGLLLFVVGGIALGFAIARVGGALRWAGIGYGAAVALFVVGFLTFRPAQPVAGALLAAVGVVLALRLPRRLS
jgi:hypothetical protein